MASPAEIILEGKKSQTRILAWFKALTVETGVKLIPVGPWIFGRKFHSTLEKLVSWRSENSRHFFAQVPPTIESMTTYLKQYSIGDSRRLLFIVYADCQPVGHLGLSNCTGESADVDNVMKGPEADGAVMRNSLVAMLEWGQAELGISRMALQVQPENWRARRLYESVGFVPAPRPESPIYGPEAPAGVKNNTERWMTLDMTRLVVSGGPPIFTAAKPH